MQMTYIQFKTMFWRRLTYFMRVRHISQYAMSKFLGIDDRAFRNAKYIKNIPRLDRLIRMADVLNINLDELCDPRIPVTDVTVDPLPIRKGSEEKFTKEKIDYFRRLTLKDTKLVLSGTKKAIDLSVIAPEEEEIEG